MINVFWFIGESNENKAVGKSAKEKREYIESWQQHPPYHRGEAG